MEEKVGTLEFLKEMAILINKRFEKCENLIEELKETAAKNENEVRTLKNHVETLEKIVNSLRVGGVDRSILKVLEGSSEKVNREDIVE